MSNNDFDDGERGHAIHERSAPTFLGVDEQLSAMLQADRANALLDERCGLLDDDESDSQGASDSEATTHNTKIFGGAFVLLVTSGAAMTQGRAIHLQQLIEVHGGKCSTEFDERATLIVGCHGVDTVRLWREALPAAVNSVTPHYIFEAVQQEELPAPSIYPWKQHSEFVGQEPMIKCASTTNAGAEPVPQKLCVAARFGGKECAADDSAAVSSISATTAPPPAACPLLLAIPPTKAAPPPPRVVTECPDASPTSSRRKRRRRPLDTTKFFCGAPPAERCNHNAHITAPLEELAEYFDNGRKGDEFRVRGYKNAAKVLKGLSFRVTDVAQVAHMRGIGVKMRAKINEIIETGNLKQRDAIQSDARHKVLAAFRGIWGAGPKTAETLLQRGYSSIADLRARHPPERGRANSSHGPRVLDRAQHVGLRYYEELQQRMPRDEVRRIRNVVSESAERCLKATLARTGVAARQPRLRCVACGSFRRGKQSCGDADVLLCVEDAGAALSWDGAPERYCWPLQPLINELERRGFLTDHLQLPKSDPLETKHNSQSYMGVCRLPGADPSGDGAPHLRRRVDIKAYPPEQFAFALLYFTGSAHFNRSMRVLAKARGLRLSEHGLFRRPANGETPMDATSVACCTTEGDIFEALGLAYRSPRERDEARVESGVEDSDDEGHIIRTHANAIVDTEVDVDGAVEKFYKSW